MDSRWYKEDRTLPKGDQREAMEATTTALQNSTLISRRLKGIIDDMIASSSRSDEDFSKDNWEREAVANIARRKVLNEIKSILP